MSEALLRVDGISKAFGGLKALQDVSFEVYPGETVALIGPNGAGKSTLLNIINGYHRPSSGHIMLGGSDLTKMAVHSVNLLGVGRTFQKIRVFKGLTVLENVRMAVRTSIGGIDVLFRTPRFRKVEQDALDHARSLLELVGLRHREEDRAASLPYGQQRLLEIARALAGNGTLLLLDEPGAGMNAEELESLQELIVKICERFGLAVLLIEHNVDFVMHLSDRIVVLDHGIVIASGSPAEIIENPRVIEAYLGRQRHD